MEGRIKGIYFIWWLLALVFYKLIYFSETSRLEDDLGVKIFCGFVLIYSAILILIRNPVIIIDKDGISYRSRLLPFASLRRIEWGSISLFEYRIVTNFEAADNHSLILEQKNGTKRIEINLHFLNKSPDQIVMEVRRLAPEFGVKELQK